MKILLISGHGNGDSGAVGCGLKEAEQTRKVSALLADLLDCDVYPLIRNAYDDVKSGSLRVKGYDYVLEIHFNAYNGKAFGTEIYYPSTSKITGFESNIMKAMGKYFTIRNGGIHSGKFAVINTCARQGIKANLLEVAFIDNANDMLIYKNKFTEIVKELALAIDELIGDDEMTGEQIAKKLDEYYATQTLPSWAEPEIKEAINLGLTDGTSLCKTIPAYRAIIIALRAYKKGLEKK